MHTLSHPPGWREQVIHDAACAQRPWHLKRKPSSARLIPFSQIRFARSNVQMYQYVPVRAVSNFVLPWMSRKNFADLQLNSTGWGHLGTDEVCHEQHTALDIFFVLLQTGAVVQFVDDIAYLGHIGFEDLVLLILSHPVQGPPPLDPSARAVKSTGKPRSSCSVSESAASYVRRKHPRGEPSVASRRRGDFELSAAVRGVSFAVV